MKLKIGLFNESFPPLIDGVSNAVRNYAEVINAKLGEAFVVTPRLKGVYDDYPYKVIRYMSVPSASKKIEYPVGNPISVPAIRMIRKEKPDLIHVHSPFSCSVLARMCSIERDIPIVVTYHTKFEQDIDYKLVSSGMKKIAKDFIKRNINDADEVWAVSKGCGESLRTIGYKGPYRVMENGTDFSKGRASQEEIDKLNEELHILPSEKVLLFVGRMMWYKNIRLILDAAHMSHINGQRFQLVFVGDGLDMDEIKAHARRLGMMQYVRFAGVVCDREKLRAYYSRASLFIFPSTYDTSGLVVKEAAACDTPSLLVRGSCAAECVEDGFSGFLCEENVLDCARTLDRALNNPNQLAAIGCNAGEHVYLSWEDSVKKAYARYGEIIQVWNTLPQFKRRRLFKRWNELHQ